MTVRSGRHGGSRRRLRGTAVGLSLVVLLGPLWHTPASAQAEQAPIAVLGSETLLPPRDAADLGLPPHLHVALVEAASGQTLVAAGATARRPIASAIKLVTALAVVAALPPGAAVVIGDEVRGIEGSSYGLRPGETRSVEDLLAGLLLRSGNDTAVALAVAVAGSEEAFTADMADVLEGLGIMGVRPMSASGLEVGDALSADELATVARAALAEPRIRALVGSPAVLLADGSEVENRNTFLTDVVGATGLKTGFTSAAGFTLAASALRDGRELVAIVLGARDDVERRDAAARLIDHGYAATRRTRVLGVLDLRTAAGPVEFRADLGTVTVGEEDDVHLLWPATVRPSDPSVVVPLSVRGAVTGSVTIDRADGRDGARATGLGRALVDGVYAALRPAALAGIDPSGPDTLR